MTNQPPIELSRLDRLWPLNSVNYQVKHNEKHQRHRHYTMGLWTTWVHKH